MTGNCESWSYIIFCTFTMCNITRHIGNGLKRYWHDVIVDFQVFSMCNNVASIIISKLKFFLFLPPYLVIPNQRHRKNDAKPAMSLVRDAVKENDEPEKMPPPSAVKGQ